MNNKLDIDFKRAITFLKTQDDAVDVMVEAGIDYGLLAFHLGQMQIITERGLKKYLKKEMEKWVKDCKDGGEDAEEMDEYLAEFYEALL